MVGSGASGRTGTLREAVRFYLLDHRTRTGKAIDVALLGLNVAFVAVFVPWQASKIVKAWAHRDKVNVTCPDCGLEYHDRDASHCKSCGHVIYQEYDSRESE